MSLLILAVGWAYTQICRIYPDGGGVYTAAKQRSRLLGVIGALLLFADYTVTASLSAVDAFHYFGLRHSSRRRTVETRRRPAPTIRRSATTAKQPDATRRRRTSRCFALGQPGLWAIVAIVVIGAFNLMGPKHTGGFAIFAAAGMVVDHAADRRLRAAAGRTGATSHLGSRFTSRRCEMWAAFVSIVLALSGVEAIANLTGVMKKPVSAHRAQGDLGRRGRGRGLQPPARASSMVAICAARPRRRTQDDMLAFIAQATTSARGASGRCASSAGCCCCRRPTPPSTG